MSKQGATLKVDWYGSKVQEKMHLAAVDAINDVTDTAAAIARANHPWITRSGNLERNTISKPAKKRKGSATGKFGSTKGDGFYGLILERKRPYLRPAADIAFRALPARIRERF